MHGLKRVILIWWRSEVVMEEVFSRQAFSSATCQDLERHSQTFFETRKLTLI